METDVYSDSAIIQTINNNNPLYTIKEEEFDRALLKFGSFMSIVKNKRINQTMLLVELLDNEIHRDVFKALSGIEKTNVLFYNLVIRFPILCKSKIVKTKIEEINERKGKGII